MDRQSLDRRCRTALLAVALAAGNAFAQSADAPFETGFLEPLRRTSEADRTPRLGFRPVAEIPLPGPLLAPGASLIGDRIVIPVAGGIARTGWQATDRPEIGTVEAPPDENGGVAGSWVQAPGGKRRYAAEPEGRIVAQRRCRRCRDGWKTSWRLRVPGGTVTPPVVTDERIFFGALDNRVYALRRNGHRLWEADVDGRVLVPPVLHRQDEHDVLLVVPGNRSRLAAISARTGSRIDAFSLPPGGDRFVGVPLLTPDGKIVLARQGYSEEEASLMVFELQPIDGDGPG